MKTMTEPIKTFDEICQQASSAFLQTVVVIDNEASLHADEQTAPTTSKTATKKRSASPGAKEHASAETAKPSAESAPEPSNAEAESSGADNDPEAHTLKLNKVSRAFAAKQLTCGVYLPSDRDPKDLDSLIRETVAAIHPTDACVLDWQLRVGDSSPAIKAIKSVLQGDEEEGGRLRLILIYTAEDLKSASEQLFKALLETDRGVDLVTSESGPVITGDHFRIAFANKPTRGRSPEEDEAVIDWDYLPEKIVAEFTTLSRGLLRAFALQSVAAVRRDMHRILAQFDEELDPVYAGDRATKPDPEDAARLVLEILQSELALTVSSNDAATHVLGRSGSSAWLESRLLELKDSNCKPIALYSAAEKVKIIDQDFRRKLIKDGVADLQRVNSPAEISRAFFSEKDVDRWEPVSEKYAILSSLAHHSGGAVRRRPKDQPSLTFGTVIGNEECDLLCVQPACDTVRLTEKTAFLFVKLIQGTSDFDLVIPVGDKLLRYEIPESSKRKHLRELCTVWFSPQESESVIIAGGGDSDGFHFEDSENKKWTWRAQLRDISAIQLAQKAIRSVGRVGLNEFEWLRTSAK